MNANEEFEIIAKVFYETTGYLAPGKSLPMGMTQADEEQRQIAWNAWNDKNGRLVEATICAVAEILDV